MIKVSVRELVEFVFRSGDLVILFPGSARAVEGTRAHQKIQQTRPDGYQPEVPVSHTVDSGGFVLEITGRIDGIFTRDDPIIIEEIKTTGLDPALIHEDRYPVHWAQARIYAHIYALQHGLATIRVQLTYYRIDTGEVKKFLRSYSRLELTAFFDHVSGRYLSWIRNVYGWIELRNASANSLSFPFPLYRSGQRDLAVAVYRAIASRKNLFVQAPTGIGKTMAVVFPAVKAAGEGIVDKIFYLTAKTSGRIAAEQAFDLLRAEGLKFKTITLTAKEKICFNAGCRCLPLECEYAGGYYDRVDEAVAKIFQLDAVTRTEIENVAREYRLCPFEFALDVSLWMDGIICDYNYVFDPRVYLRRFFLTSGGKYTLLVDEAHNLVDRAREMFSARLNKNAVLEVKKNAVSHFPHLKKILHAINSYFIRCRKQCESDDRAFYAEPKLPEELIDSLRQFTALAETGLAPGNRGHAHQTLLDLYFLAVAFCKTAELYDERYLTFVQKIGREVEIELLCLDPSKLLKEGVKRGKSAIFFSATLAPIEYYQNLLLGEASHPALQLLSPFPHHNRCLIIVDNIATTFQRRDSTSGQVSRVIQEIVQNRQGNYLVYFPSYRYLTRVAEIFSRANPGVRLVCQSRDMTDEERVNFLSMFGEHNPQTLLGFVVMGGVFGESIDLTGDRLVGAIIVGVGLPQLCPKRDILRGYFRQSGFEYAYVYPGINRVLQAAGRVIRTETDRGVIALIDERFTQIQYRRLLPPDWQNAGIVRDSRALRRILGHFWGQGAGIPVRSADEAGAGDVDAGDVDP